MKIIVTGGAGFIGSHLIDALVARGDEVVVIDYFISEAGGKLENINRGALLLKHDIRIFSEEFVKAFKGVDYVFHCAALPRVPISIKRPFGTHQINAMGTLNVLRAAALARVKKVIYSSSSSVYGDQVVLPVREDMIPNPLSPYGFQKLESEQYCRYFHVPYKLATVCLRYFNVYGPRQSDNSSYSPVMGLFLKNVQNGKTSVIYGNGSQTRAFTHVSDVVRANIFAMNCGVVKGEPINVGSNQSYTINHIAEMIGGRYEHVEPRTGDIKHSSADITKAEELLGWEPLVSLEWGIAELKKIHGLI